MDKDEFVVDAPKRPALPLRVWLTALWSLLFGIFVGFPYIGLMLWLGDDWGALAVVFAAAVFLCAHVTASALTFRRFSRKCHIRAWEFVLLSALPLLAVGLVSFLSAFISPGLDFVEFVIICTYYGGYTVLYAALLSVTLLCMRKFSRKAV